MPIKGKTFSLKYDAVNEILKHWKEEIDRIDSDMRMKMAASVNIVYNLARARRPKVARQRTPKTGKWSKAYRVSDPGAKFGVPVDTGALRESIDKEIVQNGEKTTGRIFTDKFYAPYMEFGTSKIEPRPFMKPALEANAENIKKIFEKKLKNA